MFSVGHYFGLVLVIGRLVVGNVAIVPHDVPADAVKRTVFESGTEGYNIYRIPTIVQAANGDLLAFAEAQSGGDASEIDIVMKRASDAGKSWGPLKNDTHEFYLGRVESYSNGDLDFNGSNDLNDVFLMRQAVFAARWESSALIGLATVPEPSSLRLLNGLPVVLFVTEYRRCCEGVRLGA